MESRLSRPVSTPLQVFIICGIGLLLGAATYWLSPFLLLAAVAGLIYVVFTWFLPEGAVLIMVLWASTVFDIYSLPSISIGVGHLIISDFLLIIPLCIIILRAWVEPGFNLVHTPLDFPLLAFYAVGILSTVVAIYTSTITFNQSLGEVRIVNFYLIFFIVTNLMRDQKHLRRLLNGLFVLAGLVAMAMIVQAVLGSGVPILPGRVEALGATGGTDPSVTRVLPPGQSLVMVILVALIVLLVIDRRQLNIVPRFFGVFIVSVAVILTFNRSFWVGLFLALLLVGILISIRDKIRFVNILILAALVGAFLVVPALALNQAKTKDLFGSTAARMETLFNPNTINTDSVQDRFVENSYAVPQIVSHPFIGLGLGANYRPRDRRIDYGTITWDKFAYIHNGHFWVMLKTGLIGYLFFMWLLIRFIVRGFRNWNRIRDPYFKGILLAFAAVVVGIIVADLVNPIFRASYWTPLIGIMLGTGEVIINTNRVDTMHAGAVGL